MTASRTKEVSPGIIWEAMSDGCLPNGPIVCVPIKDIYKMSDAQIGELVRVAADTAELASAANTAGNVVYESKFTGRLSRILDSFSPEDLDELMKFAGRDKEIDQAIDIVTEARAEQTLTRNRNKAKQVKRAEISANYDKIFIAIGRRDGFSCAKCGDAGSDLQIDHIFPVSKDGSNEMDNLQLLCKDCNMAKGARV